VFVRDIGDIEWRWCFTMGLTAVFLASFRIEAAQQPPQMIMVVLVLDAGGKLPRRLTRRMDRHWHSSDKACLMMIIDNTLRK
jgi:hypothetical protein